MIGLILDVFHVSAQNPLDPWNKVVPVKEICMHICIKHTHCICVCNETIGRLKTSNERTQDDIFSMGLMGIDYASS